MKTQRALVVGLGIAGMASAIALKKAGWTVTVVERAPERRRGGYFVAFFGTGIQAAKRLGVLADIHLRSPHVSKTWEVDRRGNRRRAAGFLDQPGEGEGLLRGDIEAGLFGNLEGIELRYATVPTAIVADGPRVLVTTRAAADGTERTEPFDLVVGADGVRSTVRRLAFGPDQQFLTSMGSMICAFEMKQQVPGFEPTDGVTLAEPGRAFWTFPFEDRPPTGLFAWHTDALAAQFEQPREAAIRGAFGDAPGDIIEHGLRELAAAPNHLFDSVEQVRMKSWRAGRTVLVGDAAWCMSLYSGMGASMGLAGGTFLGELLAQRDDVDSALGEYEARLMPYTRQHQRTAHLKKHMFAPTGRVSHAVRSVVLRALAPRHDAPGTRVRRQPRGLEAWLAGHMNTKFAP